jgi:hypothetical protein
MAATLTWKTGDFDPYTRDQASMFKKLAFAFLGVGTAAERATAQAEILKQPDFKAEVQATTDTSNLEAVDLTTEGVTFPSRTMRDIRIKGWCMTDNDTYFYETVETVLGGTTPVLLGQKICHGWAEEAGTPSEYGAVHLAATITALTTITNIKVSLGYALGDIATGKAPLNVPPNRLLLVKNATLNATSVSATAQGPHILIDHTNLDGLGAGTDGVVFVSTSGTGTVATDDPKVGTRIDLAFEVWPPHNHRLVMNSNNVEVQCTATDNIGDDNLKHYVEVFVGPARTIGYSAV